MDRIITGTIITLIIGGATYTINQADVAKYLAEDTGLTQEQAEQYISDVEEDELIPYTQLGSDFIEDGQAILEMAADIDCVNYEYEWESINLTCYAGKTQLSKLGRDEIALGQAYKKLGSDSASEVDIHKTIRLIDVLNNDMDLNVIREIYHPSDITEIKKTNSFNKALLQAALESD
jgi:hypothetical protein